jgi:arginyl-tRNA synthetase
MKQAVIDALAATLNGQVSKDDIAARIEIPPTDDLGDYAYPCFPLARVLRKNPAVIAQELAVQLMTQPGITDVRPTGGYLNFFVDRTELSRQVVSAALDPAYGRMTLGGTVVVEYGSPNTNKPLHLGHVRNLSIGESVSRLLEFCGCRVVRTCVNNDRGVHICKSMIAYQRWGEGVTPEQAGKKPDHLVGDFYVLFAQKLKDDESLNQAAQEMLRRWEAGDEQVLALWRTMNRWAFDGFRQTYELFGIAFDKEYFESQIYTKGKEIVLDGLSRGVFVKRDDGATVVDLTADGLDQKVLLRADGTSVYIVQDLYLAGLKNTEYSFDRSIYVVGNEQDYHFRVLTAILKRLGFVIADRLHHLSYGMVELPEGKMKSREGTVVDADDLIQGTRELAREEVASRYQLNEAQLDERSLRIALSAIKYQLLRIDTAKNMVFDPKKAIAFEGDTGPYLLYSYARAASIMRKLESTPAFEAAPPDEYELRLVKRLGAFAETVALAQERLTPSLVAGYAFGLAQTFNEFYHNCPVLKGDKLAFRVGLVSAFREVMRNCLHIMGITEIEEM